MAALKRYRATAECRGGANDPSCARFVADAVSASGFFAARHDGSHRGGAHARATRAASAARGAILQPVGGVPDAGASEAPPETEATPAQVFTVFVGNFVDAAEQAKDNWINGGWQIKKRQGKVLPEIRPNANDIGERTLKYMARPARPARTRRSSSRGRAATTSGRSRRSTSRRRRA